jgi:hypothetical protein
VNAALNGDEGKLNIGNLALALMLIRQDMIPQPAEFGGCSDNRGTLPR